MAANSAYGLNLAGLEGLQPQEAGRRLAQHGPNELPAARPRPLWSLALGVLREPMFLLLVGAGAIYLALGDLREACMLLAFVLVVMAITLYQERKTERALTALRDLSSPRALVIRGGQQVRIPGREVVKGDLLILSEGDRVPADGVVLACLNLCLDESLLSGESEPVRKLPGEVVLAMAPPGGDGLPFVYSGSLVVGGQGICQVLAVGAESQLGKIGRALASLPQEPTGLERQTRRLVRRLALAGALLCALVVVLYGLSRQDWLHGFLAGLSLAMAMLPEEFPVVLSIFLALGAWRISQKNVLTRRMPAVENLGAATVLCVDKTGTLTQNRMSVARVWAGGQFFDLGADGQRPLPEAFHQVIEFGILASQPEAFDPMDQALQRLGAQQPGLLEHLHHDWELVREYPLSHEMLALSHVWRAAGDGQYVIAAKGAPEAIADLCHLNPAQAGEMAGLVRTMAREGLRTIAVAAARFGQEPLPGGQHDFAFSLVGLVGLMDPLRPGVPAAIEECRRAGIRVVMITGDHPRTALAIAAQAGLPEGGQVLTGPELEGLDDQALGARLAQINVFARVAPEQKMRLVQALKARGEVVAMTGDGVNDAPALKAAHIGVAMGGRGTDVARESAGLVLLDDDFSSIVAAVRLGRRIYDNLRKAMSYVLAVHMPIAGLSLAPVLLGWPLILLPAHIVFLEMIIDPACSVAFEAEPEEAGIMDRPPRDPGEPLFGGGTVLASLLQGLLALAMVLGVYLLASGRGASQDQARALAFTTLVLTNLGLILANRSWTSPLLASLKRPNPALWWVLAGSLAFLGLVLYVPFLRGLFHFEPVGLDGLLLCLAAGVFSVLFFELCKLPRRLRQGGRHHERP
ncbi:MAG: cation-translocating P-type ATPase [Desulfarculus sp.]|nr:cation-translocating P-type ATPase [Desulfarculus sp.]